ncbi:MAG: transketolase [Clostridiales bacterium]|nr:transketolase [Clostridiales bacterium]
MPLTKQEWLALEKKADELRRLSLDTNYWAGSGHIGGAMSIMDMLTVLYHRYLNLKKEDPDWEDRDRFIMSKGHAGIALAPVLVDYGWNDFEQLKTFNHSNSAMGIHLDANKVVGVDASTGSLGHGLSIALGTALAAKTLGKDYKTYCIMGDGELNEGSIWEAGMAAAHFKADNLISFVDRNECMIDGKTEDVMALEPLAEKWESFGFIVKEVDGHNIKELCQAIDFALENKGAPVMIIANTVKGAGIDIFEGDYRWHYGAMDQEMYEKAKASLEKYYAQRKARVEKEA